VVTMTHFGYVKRLPKATYRAQRRGGKGITATTTREEDYVDQLFVTSTHDMLLFFTNRGRVYSLNCYEVPEAGRTARGTAIVNLLELTGGEKVTAMLPISDASISGHYLVMATREGVIKRTALEEFINLRRTGLIAITPRDEDELISVALTDGKQELLLGTRHGMAIRFSESDVRAMGRQAQGVRSIDRGAGGSGVDMSVVEEGALVLSITENGFGKRTEIEEYRLQSRAGKGIKAMNLTDKTGPLVGQLLVHEGEDILIITDDGTIIRTDAGSISTLSRNTQGVRLMRVGDGAKVVGVARAEAEEDAVEDATICEDAADDDHSDALARFVEDSDTHPEPGNDE